MSWCRASVSVLAAFALVACGGNNQGGGNGGSGGAGGSGGSGSGGTGGAGGAGGQGGAGGSGGNSGDGYTIHFALPAPVGAGKENTQCITVRLGNPTPIHVNKMHNVLGDASHHLIVYKVADTTEAPTPTPCQPFTEALNPDKGSPLAITQKHDEEIQLPDGVGITLDANQMLRLEVHYINATQQPINLMASTTMFPMSEGEFKNEAGFVFMGNIDIRMTTNGPYDVPANPASGPNLGAFLPIPAALAGVNFFAITGHEHQWGTNVTVATAASSSDPGTMVYDVPNWKWSEPATVYHNPTFSVPAGGGFRLHCSYDNESGGTVTFGESANNEMCFFWAYYYPNQGARICFHSDKTGKPIDYCCPDSNSGICSSF